MPLFQTCPQPLSEVELDPSLLLLYQLVMSGRAKVKAIGRNLVISCKVTGENDLWEFLVKHKKALFLTTL